MKETFAKPRRKFDDTFRREAVTHWLSIGKSAEVIAEELARLGLSTICRLHHQHRIMRNRYYRCSSRKKAQNSIFTRQHMKELSGVLCSIVGAAFCTLLQAEEVAIKAEKAVVITFPSQPQRMYKLLAAENAAGNWTPLQDGIVGTGGEVTIFYKSESDQKVFFKIETSDGPPGQRALLSLANLDISGEDLSGYDLEGGDLRGFKFHATQFDGANLVAANISDADFDSADFAGADLRHAVAVGTKMQRAIFNQANLEGIRFVSGNVVGADFRNANLKGVVFAGTEIEGANFAGQTLTNFSFRALPGAALGNVDFTGANLAGADLSRNSAEYTKFHNANLTGANLEGVSFQNVDMKGQDLRDAFLRGIAARFGDWSGVNLSGTDLSLAYLGPTLLLTDANFERANLEGVVFDRYSDSLWQYVINGNFRGANLKSADMRQITFDNCDFTGADLSFADLSGASFAGSVGLDTEQPGMTFSGTFLPDRTTRNGQNPGAGTAPTNVPPRLQLSMEGRESGTLEFEPYPTPQEPYPTPQPRPPFMGTFSIVGQGAVGTYNYTARGRVAMLELSHPEFSTPWGSPANLKLRFTSPTSGELFKAEHPSATREATYLIGTFTVPQ